MTKGMIIGTVLGAIAVTAGGAFAGYGLMNNRAPDVAQVTGVSPIKQSFKTPRQECHDETVVHKKAVKDENRITGSVIGAVVGGVLGHQVGGGSGKKIATVAGAAAGGYAGNQVQKNMQDSDTYTTTEQRCKTVYDTGEKVVGYNVSYTIAGEPGKVRMDHDPGATIPIRNGMLVLDGSAAAPAEKPR